MLGMSLVPRIVQLCVICDYSVQSHDENCPCYQLNLILDNTPVIQCPHCRKDVDLNRDDYFECRKCHKQFATGGFFDNDPKSPVMILHNRRGDEYLKVKELKTLGNSDFPKDARRKALQKEIRNKRRNAQRRNK